MGLRERLGLAAQPPRPVSPFPAALERATWVGKPPVGPSEDLNRVVALPRRVLTATPAETAALEGRLRLPPSEVRCVCKTFDPPRACPEHFKEGQALSLLEAERYGYLLSKLGVGQGKTLINMMLPWVLKSKVAVLFLPAALMSQFIERDWPYYGGHWRLPNLAGGQWFHAGRPVLHVQSYERLSRQECSVWLKSVKPDLVMADEAHKLKGRKSARTLRVERDVTELRKTQPVRFVPISGTFASRGIADGAHLADWALGEMSPYPRKHGVVEEWARALDPVVNDNESAAAPGALERFCNPGEHVREAYGRRVNETPGVVAVSSSSFNGSILIRKRVPKMPAAILPLIRGAWKGKRPDGEQADEQLQAAMWVRQLSCGFFHRWRFPRGEPEELIARWRAARKEWNRAVYKKLEHPREHLDTPGLCKNAARRAWQSPPYEGDLPTWKAIEWPTWAEVEPLVEPVPSTVWLDRGCPELAPIPGCDFLVNDAVEWIRTDGPGIVWCEFPELGSRIASAAGVPWYGGGERASAEIVAEKGDRSIVASMHAHRDGKNLQYAFFKNYFTSPFSDGGLWEQAIGRTHRDGQREDTVIVDVAQHTEEFCEAFTKARERARFVAQTEHQPQKLLLADYQW